MLCGNCKLKARFYKRYQRALGAPGGGPDDWELCSVLVPANSSTSVTGTDHICVKQEDGVAAI